MTNREELERAYEEGKLFALAHSDCIHPAVIRDLLNRLNRSPNEAAIQLWKEKITKMYLLAQRPVPEWLIELEDNPEVAYAYVAGLTNWFDRGKAVKAGS